MTRTSALILSCVLCATLLMRYLMRPPLTLFSPLDNHIPSPTRRPPHAPRQLKHATVSGNNTKPNNNNLRRDCTKGDPVFTNDFLKSEFENFLSVYKKRPRRNKWGTQINHQFALFAIIRLLQPRHIIESGVMHGMGTWLLRQAAPPDTQLILLDPWPREVWYEDTRPSTIYFTSSTVHFKARPFQDFNQIDWDALGVDKNRTLVFFDDHMSTVRRSMEAWTRGFTHLVFDDNYRVGEGDLFSFRHACAVYWPRRTSDVPGFTFTDRLLHDKHEIGALELVATRFVLDEVVQVLYEFPILIALGVRHNVVFEDLDYKRLKEKYKHVIDDSFWSTEYWHISYVKLNTKR